MAGTGRPRSERRRPKGRQESGDRTIGSSTGASHNWPDTGPGARLRKQADVRRVNLVDEAARPPELRDKLDTREVNGPKDTQPVAVRVDGGNDVGSAGFA